MASMIKTGRPVCLDVRVGARAKPLGLDRVAGGSSGGAAAAVAAGVGPLAEGSDLAGSIRVPASCCGVVGLKPSLGRVPRYPSANGWTAFGVTGPIARTVRDAALLLSVLAGPDDRDPLSLPETGEDFVGATEREIRRLCMAWSPDLGYAAVDREVQSLCSAAAEMFQSLGCVVEEEHPGFQDPETRYLDLTAPLRAAMYSQYLTQWQDQMDPILVKSDCPHTGHHSGGLRACDSSADAFLAHRAPFLCAVRCVTDAHDGGRSVSHWNGLPPGDCRTISILTVGLVSIQVPFRYDWAARHFSAVRLDPGGLTGWAPDSRPALRRCDRAQGGALV
jgi:Amidase